MDFLFFLSVIIISLFIIGSTCVHDDCLQMTVSSSASLDDKLSGLFPLSITAKELPMRTLPEGYPVYKVEKDKRTRYAWVLYRGMGTLGFPPHYYIRLCGRCGSIT